MRVCWFCFPRGGAGTNGTGGYSEPGSTSPWISAVALGRPAKCSWKGQAWTVASIADLDHRPLVGQLATVAMRPVGSEQGASFLLFVFPDPFSQSSAESAAHSWC